MQTNERNSFTKAGTWTKINVAHWSKKLRKSQRNVPIEDLRPQTPHNESQRNYLKNAKVCQAFFGKQKNKNRVKCPLRLHHTLSQLAENSDGVVALHEFEPLGQVPHRPVGVFAVDALQHGF